MPCQTLGAVSARGLDVAPSYSVADREYLYIMAKFLGRYEIEARKDVLWCEVCAYLDDPDAFVAEDHVPMALVFIRSTDA